MKLYIQTDKTSDQVYIGVWRKGAMSRGGVKKTVQVSDEIALDLDVGGRLVGIDIANASRVLGRDVFREAFSTDDLVGVAEAAKLCGVKKPNFVRDFADRPDFPTPIAELASGRIWLRSQIDSYFQGKERPAKRLRSIA